MSKVFVIQMVTGEMIIGIKTSDDSDDRVTLSYPITLTPIVENTEQGPQHRMSINPYFPFAEYDAKDGVTFDRKHCIHVLQANEGLTDAHAKYVNQRTVEDNNIIVAQASDLPENNHGVDPSVMVGGGLRNPDS